MQFFFITGFKKFHISFNFFIFKRTHLTGNKSFKNKQEIARGGRYDNLLKSLGSKKDVSAVGAAINLNNLSRLMQ
jgi:histidyl-tRNA synthetase